ncbi:MAG TPA: metal-dependent hydrolase [Povalibacter sp.]|uniref:metal-dependent hydrolase n=1 Tax=Povalibacter sp. TaxID=1962978 RepID=UPI002C15074C|nr:metal-dependent hydrolase [Povalibacter sp.]HMN44762.1 metal-dependent hydrolase [Povalibacter sp.]
MSGSPAATPADLRITSRALPVREHANTARWWHGGDPVATAWFNALSVTFPQGETFFIESVRRYRDEVGSGLGEQINAFVQQEAMHTREHVAFNKLIRQAGYSTARMDEHTRKRLDIARSRHPIGQLAMTVALEHFTAILAHALLTDADPLPGAPPDVLKLWQWHAIEEIEHKSVAYDTYVAATKNLSAARCYFIRCKVMLLVSLLFWKANFRHMADFCRQDGMNSAGTWWRVAKYLLGRPGIVRKIFRPYLSFYRPGFHPWDHDDRALIARVEQSLVA